jgi:glycosyltransferase involved in cell wall biosynthesis
MNILAVFNYYQQPGGEEQAFQSETALLESRGHAVTRFCMRNDHIREMNPLMLAGKLMWNAQSAREVYRLVRDNRIDVAHFHNTFPLISPSVCYAAREAGARVVHTLHNFRLLCPGALLARDGKVCEECVGKTVPWRGIQHGCYRGSRLQTAAVTTMLAAHNTLRTWTRQIDAYIALSAFARDKFIAGGLPAHKITVKPNFVDPDPGMGDGKGSYALFAGRLDVNKGVDVLLRAWRSLGDSIPLKIAGDGPMSDEVRAAAASNSGIEYLGHKQHREVLALMKHAAFLVFPSLWYEGFPMTLAEAYAVGLPVISSRLGTMESVVRHGVTGFHFEPGNAEDLIASVLHLENHPREAERLRENARREYLQLYSPNSNYDQLIRIYESTRQRAPSIPVDAAA